MIVANRATLSGIIRTPFLSSAGQRFSGGIHNNIRLDLSPTQLGFGRMRSRPAHMRFVQDKNDRFGPLMIAMERPAGSLWSPHHLLRPLRSVVANVWDHDCRCGLP